MLSGESDALYLKLLGETAAIRWAELAPFFAKGNLLQVAAGLDLVEVAAAMAGNDPSRVSGWLESAGLCRLEAGQARCWHEADPPLWAVVVAPWVLVQERAGHGPENPDYTGKTSM